jgi:ubiquinone/menaquinone biosynthesis C-methylase UbiE
MAAADKAFTGSIPDLYERHLVPLIFEPYARDAAVRVRQLVPRSVLETAAGTGVVTRRLATALPATTRLVATDLNAAMLAVARDRVGQARPIEWLQTDAQALPFAAETFDVVLCQFGIMFFPEPLQAFREARRVLKRSGRLIFSVWDSIGANDFADTVTQSLAELFPADPPRFLVRTPYGHCDTVGMATALKQAGFSDVKAEVVEHVSRSPSPHGPAVAYCQGTPLRGEIMARNPTGLPEATRRVAESLATRFGQGPIEGRMRAIVFDSGR